MKDFGEKILSFHTQLAPRDGFDFKGLMQDPNLEKLDASVITLACAWNEMKDVLSLLQGIVIGKEAFKPGSSEDGQLTGMQIYLTKLSLSVSHEFLAMLRDKDNRELFLSNEFTSRIANAGKEELAKWNTLMDMSQGKDKVDPKLAKFANAIARVRNNIGFHYYQLSNLVPQAYKRFFDKHPDVKAQLSRGDCMESSRYYFADAVSQECLGIHVDLMGNEEFRKAHFDMLSNINLSLRKIINCYLFSRGIAYKRMED